MSSYVSSNWRTGTSQGTPDNGPRAKCDQVVFEAIAKAAEIIVASRGGAPDSVNANSSSRFNLQVPEIPGVRTILQRSRRALHVPLRVDVYYQHPPSTNGDSGNADSANSEQNQGQRRELLERWCLEYVPCRLETFLNREGTLTQDPIAQLRHVCKRIVTWLRTLYCWSRLLPAQGFRTADGNGHNPIGFSIYVVSDGSDDVSDLVKHQGFSSQQQPSSVVTPYGELGWRAIYVDKSVVDRLLPARGHASRSPLWGPRLSNTTARPIPIHPNGNGNGNGGASKTKQIPGNGHGDRGMVPQSAPAHLVDSEWHNTDTVDESLQQHQQHQHELHQQQDLNHQHKNQQHRQQSYDPNDFHRRTHSTIDGPLHHGPDLQRRNTGLGNERATPSMNQQYAHSQASSTASSIAEKPPERVMSGLSLALMMSDERGENGQQAAPPSDLATAEKRRAALHQMPPHLLMEQQQQQQQQQAAASPGATTTPRKNHRPAAQGEYGYAYNNHIPWQRIHPSSTNPTLGRSPSADSEGRYLSTSPSPSGSLGLAFTPPSGAFLGPGNTPPVTSSAHFIPPRSSITPPFASRPAGFSQQPPPQPLPPTAEQPGDQQGQQRSRYGDTLPPLASLDLLHSSPFQHAHGSLLSSLSLAPPAGGADSASAMNMMMNSGDLRRSMWSASAGASAIVLPSGTGAMQGDDGDDDEMPFAVDESSSSQYASASNTAGNNATMNTGSTSQLGASSAAVASFAQKCAPSNRLKMFDSSIVTPATGSASQQQQQDPDDMVNSLADQLAEFRSFGASLDVSSPTSGGGGGGGGSGSEHDPGASSSTPITLRT